MKRLTAHAARLAWLAVGIVALTLGALGVVLPLLPTTPFVLVAAFAFAQSSERLHAWLVNHNIFGELIANWRRYGAISRTTKVASVLSMATVLAVSLLLDVPTSIVVVQAVVLSACAFFIVSRPLPPDDRAP